MSSIAIDPLGRIWAVDEDLRIYIYDGNTGELLGIFDKNLSNTTESSMIFFAWRLVKKQAAVRKISVNRDNENI